MTTPHVEPFFHRNTNTIAYIVSDPASRHCMIIDSVLDFDSSAGRTSTVSADGLIAHINDAGLTVDWILENFTAVDRSDSGKTDFCDEEARHLYLVETWAQDGFCRSVCVT